MNTSLELNKNINSSKLIIVLIVFVIINLYFESYKFVDQSKIYNFIITGNKDSIFNGLLNNSISSYFIGNLASNQNESKSNSQNCTPFLIDYKQYSVNINGQIYPKSMTNYKNKSINFECLNQNVKSKTILFWNPFFGDFKYSFGLGDKTPFVKNKCPVTNCELTNNRDKLNDSDLVIVHMRDRIDQPPASRPLNQRWIFMLYESPIHSGDYSGFNGVFNMTSTYRIQSDFPSFYEDGTLITWQKNINFNKSYDFLATKSEFAAAVISNCNVQSDRTNYIKELQNYIKVDIFGKCGRQCPKHFKNNTPSTDCKEILGTDYKFYFAFENSICRDYITEKFFNILKYNIIPVVLGGGNYEHFVIIYYYNML
jgi:hypothetical protein